MFGISAHPSGALERGLERIPQLPLDIVTFEHHEMTRPQVLEEWGASSLSTQNSFPLHLGTTHVKKIYHRHVQMKRGVTVSWDRAEVVEPASRKTKVEESALPEETTKTFSPLSTQEHLPERESNLESKAPQGREQAGSAGQCPAQEESSRAMMPERLVGLGSGFRGLACCRVFPSLEVLQDHMEHTYREGFSCQVFHCVFSCLKRKNEEEEDEKEEEVDVEEEVEVEVEMDVEEEEQEEKQEEEVDVEVGVEENQEETI
ncbi:Protein FAM170A [Manis javanica]|nr:Protein FAM170A [Manis javanica]